MNPETPNKSSVTFYLVTAILFIIFMMIVTAIFREYTQKYTQATPSNNVRGVASVQAQAPQTANNTGDETLPDQNDAKHLQNYFIDLLHGVPDETDSDTTTIQPGAPGGGGGGGGGGGPVVIDDPGFLARLGPPFNGYYQLPPPVGDEYDRRDGDECSWANVELLKLVNQTAIRWKAKYPDSRVQTWNFNASGGHASHQNGIDVDIAITNESAANMCSAFYDQPGTCGGGLSEGACRSIELGKMFLESNIVQMIFYDDQDVDNAIMAYARDAGKTNFIIAEPWGTQACGAGHHNHFHVRILDDYRLPTYLPSGC